MAESFFKPEFDDISYTVEIMDYNEYRLPVLTTDNYDLVKEKIDQLKSHNDIWKIKVTRSCKELYFGSVRPEKGKDW